MTKSAFIQTPRFRSGIFALVFAPIALILMGSSMADIQTQTAMGQPLASVEGMIGVALSSSLLALVSINCDISAAGMAVTCLMSIPIGLLQLSGFLSVPVLMASRMGPADMNAAMLWNFYPVCVTLITAGATASLTLVRPSPSLDQTQRLVPSSHRHAWAASISLPACASVLLILIDMAPADSSQVGASGLAGILFGYTLRPFAGLIVGLLLAITAFVTHWSLTGPQFAGWAVLILPSYLLEPLWASLTGRVVTPGASTLTQIALAAPVAASLGLVLTTTTIGVYWARKTDVVESPLDTGAEFAPHEGQAGGPLSPVAPHHPSTANEDEAASPTTGNTHARTPTVPQNTSTPQEHLPTSSDT
ncbi:hypothetical protein G7Y41_00340 [Schaalia sp. ZJ405]|uniref:hypothetical protein n=1 Tax=Schaalia sp. ZJ405 TaxID=2709403 RepID=UPI0013ED8835|nr:hypothetical protein [Schaalia sp. ZJ405]QPK81375.1 hypothetical protein G7Y41_00340 [Schaalia sp. ZJ405]